MQKEICVGGVSLLIHVLPRNADFIALFCLSFRRPNFPAKINSSQCLYHCDIYECKKKQCVYIPINVAWYFVLFIPNFCKHVNERMYVEWNYIRVQ